MTHAEVAARYRDYAAQCLAVAKHQKNERDRLALVDMAQAWLMLADQAAKDKTPSAVHKTPEKAPR